MAGLSMGGALALRIAATRPVAGAVLVNPGLVIDDPRAPLAGILKFVLKSTPAIANDILKEGIDEGAYPRTPVAAAHELNRMFKDTVRLLPRITAPVRVYRSAVDHVVSDSSMRGPAPRPDPRPAGGDPAGKQLPRGYDGQRCARNLPRLGRIYPVAGCGRRPGRCPR